MSRADNQDLMLYWNPKTADDILKSENILDYVASDQLRRVLAGDVIWIVTVVDGELFLLGRLLVGVITDRNGAIKQLGNKNIWGNKMYYGIAVPGKVEQVKKISLKNIAKKLIFKSVNKESTRLNIDMKDNVNAQQLQTMRILDVASAQLLEQVWQK